MRVDSYVIIKTGRDPHSLIRSCKDFNDTIIESAEDVP